MEVRKMDYTMQPGEGPLDMMNRQARMTRDERQEEIAKRQKVVDGMLRWIAENRREPTQRESDSIRHNHNMIESLKLGLENELRDAG
jgi:hypothetical protein